MFFLNSKNDLNWCHKLVSIPFVLSIFFAAKNADAQILYFSCIYGTPNATWIQPIDPNATPYQGMKLGSIRLTVPLSVYNIRVRDRLYVIPGRVSGSGDYTPIESLPGVSSVLTLQSLQSTGGTSLSLFGRAMPFVVNNTTQNSAEVVGQYTSVGGNPRMHQYNFQMDIFITDLSEYRGGSLSTTDALKGYKISTSMGQLLTSGVYGANSQCHWNFGPAGGDAGGNTPIPPGPTPTCSFDWINGSKTVRLREVSQSQVPARGSIRSDGASAEELFHLMVNECKKDASFEVYFTDAKEPNATKDYLNLESSGAGFRIYSGNSTTPVVFAAAPSGSTTNPAAVALKVTKVDDGHSQAYPFYAQYVKMGANAPAGLVRGEAIATVVYP